MKFNSLILFLLISSFVFAGDTIANESKLSIFDQLNFEEVINVTIETNMDTLTANIRNDDKHVGVFSYIDKYGVQKAWDIKVKLRGKFRRMICGETPPLKIYFEKEDLKNAGLAKYDDLKLVNYCVDDRELAKELLMKEYLTYKMYNEITDESFRVQLINVTYKDTKSGKEITQYAFLIEDAAQLRSRLGAEKFKDSDLTENDTFDLDQMRTMSLFQYMIGNTDWQVNFEKNTKFLLRDNQRIIIAYDFDFTGMVNPSYGRANSTYGLTTLTERVYLGSPDNLKNIKQTIKLFKEKKKSIYALVKSNKLLKKKSRNEIMDYLDSFYENLNPETIEAAIPKAAGAAVK